MIAVVLTILLAGSAALYDDPVADLLVRNAEEASYMLHLEDARNAARELQQRYPDHPAGFLIMAETYWWEAQTDPHNPKTENAYYKAQELAQDKAELAIKAGKYAKVELLAYLASAHGSYARFEVTQKGSYYH